MKRRITIILVLLVLALGVSANAAKDDGIFLRMDFNGGSWSGSNNMTVACVYGEDVTQIVEPIRPGYQFGGWYTDENCTKPWMEKTIVRDTTIYAKWLDIESIMPSLDNFVPVSTYRSGQFTDVVRGAWYEENVAAAYELGLMKGSSSTTFNVKGNVTVAEAITMAARLHSIYFTGTESFVQSGSVWYRTYVTYAAENGITTRNYNSYTRAVTRGEFAEIFCNAFPGRALELYNCLEDGDIPDVDVGDDYWKEIYCLYRAGILTGSDKRGTFHPDSFISRPEAAAIVTRMADPDLRKAISFNQELTMVEYAGMTVSEVADKLGWDFTYGEGWWYGASKPFYYSDDRVPYFFFFTDSNLKGYAKGNEVVDLIEYYPGPEGFCEVAPGVRSDLTYNELRSLGLGGDFGIIDDEGGDIGNTAYFSYYYDTNTTIHFYWYEDHSPYSTPAESVAVYYDAAEKTGYAPYDQKIEEYQFAMDAGQESFEAIYQDDCSSINAMAVGDCYRYGGNIAFAVCDIDSDDVPELLFSDFSTIVDIYTIRNYNIVKVYPGCGFGYRDRLHVLSGGRLLNEGSSSAFASSCNLAVIGKNGTAVTTEAYYYDDWGPDMYMTGYTYLSATQYGSLIDNLLQESILDNLYWTVI